MNLSYFTDHFIYQNIILFGTLSSCIATIGLLFLLNLRRQGNVYLVLFIFSLGMNNLSNYMIEVHLHKLFPIIPLLPLSLTLLIPISLYLHFKSDFDKSFKDSIKKNILISLVWAELLFYLTLMVVYGLQEGFVIESASFIAKLFQLKELVSIFTAVGLSADILFLLLYPPLSKEAGRSGSVKEAKVIFAFSMLIVVWWITSYVYGFFEADFSRTVYYPIWCISTVVILLSAWYAVKRERTAEDVGLTGESESSRERYEALLFRLQQVVVDEKLYKRSITLKELSENSGISTGQITKLLKNNNQNFSSFINHYRIEEAKKLLLEQNNFKYTMDFIGEEAGFSSRASFFNIFKSATGKTPKQYRQEMELDVPRAIQNHPEDSNLV